MSKTANFWINKCVIITGASSGIGAALAHYLLMQGAKVGLLARTKNKLEIFAQQLGSTINNPVDKIAWACVDVNDADAMKFAVQQLEIQLGHCDILIASAGIYYKTEVMNFNAATENAMISTNVQGVINSVAAVMPNMIKRQSGHIVAVSSIAGMIGLPAAAGYSASKAALIAFFQSLRVDLYPLGVKATIVAPGVVDTPMITDEERETSKDLISANQAAQNICRAIQKNSAVAWFPWQPWLACRLLSWLPNGLYRRLVLYIPEMEETIQNKKDK